MTFYGISPVIWLKVRLVNRPTYIDSVTKSFCMDHNVLTMEGLARSYAVSGCLVQAAEQ